jgi:hypothetical protein
MRTLCGKGGDRSAHQVRAVTQARLMHFAEAWIICALSSNSVPTT